MLTSGVFRAAGLAVCQSPNLKTFKEPRDRFQGIDSDSLCSLAARYDNNIFVLARQAAKAGGIDTSESIPGPLKRLQIRAQLS
jgi:hypothetical protein